MVCVPPSKSTSPPNLEVACTLSVLPSDTKSRTAKLEPRRASPYVLKDEPKRENFRILSADPNVTKSSTDRTEPSRATPKTDIVLENDVWSWIEMVCLCSSLYRIFFWKDARPARWGPPDGWEPPGAGSRKVDSLKKKWHELLSKCLSFFRMFFFSWNHQAKRQRTQNWAAL